jgi:hypothetical protein
LHLFCFRFSCLRIFMTVFFHSNYEKCSYISMSIPFCKETDCIRKIEHLISIQASWHICRLRVSLSGLPDRRHVSSWGNHCLGSVWLMKYGFWIGYWILFHLYYNHDKLRSLKSTSSTAFN